MALIFRIEAEAYLTANKQLMCNLDNKYINLLQKDLFVLFIPSPGHFVFGRFICKKLKNAMQLF